MTDPATAERLARLQARRNPRAPAFPAADLTTSAPTTILGMAPEAPPSTPPVAPPAPSAGHRSGLQLELSWARAATAMASTVSFASMIVAMGPLFQATEATSTDAGSIGDDSIASGAGTLPTAPPLTIDVTTGADRAPEPQRVAAPTADLPVAAAEPAAPIVSTATATPATAPQPAPTQPPATQPQAAQPASTQPPATQAPASQAPVTAAPATQPPTTKAPATTAPPATAPPPTAPPPTTAAPTTAPPRSDGSG